MKVTVTQRGPDLEAAMAKAARAVPAVSDEVAETAADLIAARARGKVPARTGRARGSVRVDPGQGAARVLAGGSRARYFGWLDYGGRLREQNISRPYRRPGRYIYPAAGEVWPKVIRELEDGATDIVRAAGLRI